MTTIAWRLAPSRSFFRIRKRRGVFVFVFALLLAMLESFTIRAQPMFGHFYEQMIGNSIDRQPFPSYAENKFLDTCLNCSERRNFCLWGGCAISIPRPVLLAETICERLWVFGTTLELLFRGFALGFGLRLLKALFSPTTTHDSKPIPSVRSQLFVDAAVAGISLAAFLYGSSLFVPAKFREEWYRSNGSSSLSYSDSYSHDHPNTTLPVAVYHHIRQTLLQNAKTVEILECPSYESSDDGNCASEATMIIDWTNYVRSRIQFGFLNLANTVEVLIRGFSLGCGIRMLAFLLAFGENELLESLLHRALETLLTGLSLATVLHGAAFFVPADLRDQWFSESSSRSRDYLKDTIEVLLRGFSLGFGLRMVRFWFLSETTIDDDDGSSSSSGVVAFWKSTQRRALVSTVAGLSLSTILHGSFVVIPKETRDQWFLASSESGDHGAGDTIEVLWRGFSLGFGIQMLRFVFFSGDMAPGADEDNGRFWESSKRRALSAAVAGVSLATTLSGASFFLPLDLREDWSRVADYERYRFEVPTMDLLHEVVTAVLFYGFLAAVILSFFFLPKLVISAVGCFFILAGVVFLIILFVLLSAIMNLGW
jgi:hypothetical protein